MFPRERQDEYGGRPAGGQGSRQTAGSRIGRGHTRSVVVVGTGIFAKGVCVSLARALVRRPTTVHVLGRSEAATAAICALANAHAQLLGAPVRFHPAVAPLDAGR